MPDENELNPTEETPQEEETADPHTYENRVVEGLIPQENTEEEE